MSNAPVDLAPFCNIPLDLRDRPQWVLWRYLYREVKPTKVPFGIDGQPASSTDASTWSSFSDAMAHAHQYDGAGFVIRADDPFVCVDLDDAIDGECKPHHWVREIIQRLNSYTERSPSRTGFHVWVRARVPDGGCRRGDLEMYDRARYICMTGHRIVSYPNSIEYRQREIEGIHANFIVRQKNEGRDMRIASTAVQGDDRELLQRAMQSDIFARLWHGDMAGYGNDHSAADLALCHSLAYWTNCDAARIDRLFRQSALMREKWDARRGETTYGQQRIFLAISSRIRG